MVFEKFSLEDFVSEIQQMVKILENFDKETRMWRIKYIDSREFNSQEEKDIYAYTLLSFPAGIDNISDWENKLKCYHETREEKK